MFLKGLYIPSRDTIMLLASASASPCAIVGSSMELKSDFLYARPSFIAGIARLIDLFGTFDEYNRSPNPRIADARALYSDWGLVGIDIARSIDRETKKMKRSRRVAPSR